MPNESNAGLWTRHLSRRSLLHAGGLGVAATAFNSMNPMPVSARANTAERGSMPLHFGMTHDELSDSERVMWAVDQLESVVTEMMERSEVPGVAISVTSAEETIYAHGFGLRDSQSSDPVDENTVFQLASVSKPFASTVIAGLVSDGYLSWNSRISDLMPEFQMFDSWTSREVTVADMIAHRSGLPGHAGDLLEDLGYSRDEVLYRLRYQKPEYSLRDGYRYTNFGYTAGAVAAARAAGMNWEEASRNRLYDRIGLSRTSSLFSEFMAHSNRARGHVKVDGEWRAVHVRNPDPQSPAGGVSSSVSDLAKWMRLHLCGGEFDGEQVISHEALAETHLPRVVSQPAANPLTERSSFYGLGWNVSFDGAGRVRLGHSGAFELGAGTSVSVIPAWNVGISVLTNAAPIGLPESIIASFVDLIETGEIQRDYLELFGELFAMELAPNYRVEFDEVDDPTPPLANSSYAGVFESSLYGNVEVVEAGNGLQIRIGPGPMEFDLEHFDRDVFLYEPEGENAYGPSAVTFAIDPDGNAAQVTIDSLNHDGQGVFERASDAVEDD